MAVGTQKLLKHREVARAIVQEIQAGKWLPGDRLPGEYELARQFDVAYMTLRQAVASLVDDGILLRVRGKGTFIAAPTQAPDAASFEQKMAFLFPTNWQADPYYFPEVLAGFQGVMQPLGHKIEPRSYDALEATDTLARGSVIACFLLNKCHTPIVEGLRDRGHTVLAVNNYTGRRAIPSVHIDDASGIEDAVDHLVKLGHETIGFVLGPADNLDAEDRLRGFRSAVARHGLDHSQEAGDDFSEIAGYAAAQSMLASKHPPTAIVCTSDLSAMGAIKAARDNGLSVPRNLSVVGFGDFSVADYVLPTLTTVRQSRIALGRATAEALLQLANGDDVQSLVMSAELIVRDSTVANPFVRAGFGRVPLT